MDFWLALLPRHGYAILCAAAFLEAIGLPVPAAVALMIAGGASARGILNPFLAFGAALSAVVLADALLFVMGRYTGWWVLGLLCRLSLNPESCILRSANSFRRRGRVLLVFAKFLPGINTMAPPVAGSMNMRFSQFFGLDLAGASLYVGVYFCVGLLFSGALGAITSGYRMFGHVLVWVAIAAIAGYGGLQLWMWARRRPLRSIPFVSPSQAAGLIAAEGAVVYDVRSHGYYDKNAERIRGSRRLDPNALPNLPEEFPADKQVYLYCTCIRQATSARVAQMLLERGVHSAVLEGGLRAWKKAGLPLEPVPLDDMAALPSFDS